MSKGVFSKEYFAPILKRIDADVEELFKDLDEAFEGDAPGTRTANDEEVVALFQQMRTMYPPALHMGPEGWVLESPWVLGLNACEDGKKLLRQYVKASEVV